MLGGQRKPTCMKLSGPRSSPGLSSPSLVSRNLDEGTWGMSLSGLGLNAGGAYDINVGYITWRVMDAAEIAPNSLIVFGQFFCKG